MIDQTLLDPLWRFRHLEARATRRRERIRRIIIAVLALSLAAAVVTGAAMLFGGAK